MLEEECSTMRSEGEEEGGRKTLCGHHSVGHEDGGTGGREHAGQGPMNKRNSLWRPLSE